MSLLTTKITKTKTLQTLLDETDTHYSIIGKPDQLTLFLKSHNAQKLDLTSQETLDEIQFVQFLTKRYGEDEPFCEKYTWSSYEKIDTKTIEQLRNDAKTKQTSFEEEFQEFLFEYLLDWQPDYDVINDFYYEYDVYENDDFYIDLFNDYAKSDFNADLILKQSQA